MEVDVRQVKAGVAAAHERALLHLDGFDFDQNQFDSATKFIVEVLRPEEDQWSARAVHLAAEAIAIGFIARVHFPEEGELSVDEVRAEFIPPLRQGVNSWLHD